MGHSQFLSAFSFPSEARERHARDHQDALVTRHSRIVSEAEFAQIPILNSGPSWFRAGGSRFRATFISDANNDLPVPQVELRDFIFWRRQTDGSRPTRCMMVTQILLW